MVDEGAAVVGASALRRIGVWAAVGIGCAVLGVSASVAAAGSSSDSATTPPSFSEWRLDPGPETASAAIADLNDDGRSDIVWSTTRCEDTDCTLVPNTVYLSEQLLDGTLAAPVALYTDQAGDSQMYVAVGDFNGDGRSDIAVAATNKTVVLEQTATGFAAPVILPGPRYPGGLVAADLDQDGKTDLIGWTSDGVANTGTTTIYKGPDFASSTLDTGHYVWDVAVGDLNGDGRADIAVARYGDANSVRAYLRQSNGSYVEQDVPGLTNVEGVAIGDATGDGRNDLVVTTQGAGNFTSNESVYPQLPDGSLGAAVTEPEFDFPSRPTIADLNGDGRDDFLVYAAGGPGQITSIGVRMQNTDGSLGSESYLPFQAGDGRAPVEVGDVNGDGLADIVTTDPDPDEGGLIVFYQLPGTATTTATAPTTTSMPTTTAAPTTTTVPNTTTVPTATSTATEPAGPTTTNQEQTTPTGTTTSLTVTQPTSTTPSTASVVTLTGSIVIIGQGHTRLLELPIRLRRAATLTVTLVVAKHDLCTWRLHEAAGRHGLHLKLPPITPRKGTGMLHVAVSGQARKLTLPVKLD